MYLVKHSFHDLANMTRELSKANEGANPAANKELLRVIIDTKNLGFKIETTLNSSKPWEILHLSNGDYAGDLVSTLSISRFILYVLGVLDSWKLKPQKSVSLFS